MKNELTSLVPDAGTRHSGVSLYFHCFDPERAHANGYILPFDFSFIPRTDGDCPVYLKDENEEFLMFTSKLIPDRAIAQYLDFFYRTRNSGSQFTGPVEEIEGAGPLVIRDVIPIEIVSENFQSVEGR